MWRPPPFGVGRILLPTRPLKGSEMEFSQFNSWENFITSYFHILSVCSYARVYTQNIRLESGTGKKCDKPNECTFGMQWLRTHVSAYLLFKCIFAVYSTIHTFAHSHRLLYVLLKLNQFRFKLFYIFRDSNTQKPVGISEYYIDIFLSSKIKIKICWGVYVLQQVRRVYNAQTIFVCKSAFI